MANDQGKIPLYTFFQLPTQQFCHLPGQGKTQIVSVLVVKCSDRRVLLVTNSLKCDCGKKNFSVKHFFPILNQPQISHRSRGLRATSIHTTPELQLVKFSVSFLLTVQTFPNFISFAVVECGTFPCQCLIKVLLLSRYIRRGRQQRRSHPGHCHHHLGGSLHHHRGGGRGLPVHAAHHLPPEKVRRLRRTFPVLVPLICTTAASL